MPHRTQVNSDDVGIWQDFLSLQIKETTQRAYGKSLADFCHKVYPLLSLSDALQSFLLLSQFDALHQVLTYRKILIDLKLSSGGKRRIRTK
jgi:hypothetical protein